MTKKICPCTGCEKHEGSCPNIVDSGRCARCRRDRGTTTEQGLGWQHQKQRAKLIAAAIGTWCPDCPAKGRATLMTDPKLMVADHPNQDRSRPASHVHCRRCSDEQGGRLGHHAVDNQ